MQDTLDRTTTLGACPRADGKSRFRVWAPRVRRVEVVLADRGGRSVAMTRDGSGYHEAVAEARPGERYLFRLDGTEERPDPASRHQVEGVRGPSAVVSPDFAWTDAGWAGLDAADFLFYELHVGAFTREGTFDAAIGKLDALAELGVTAVELMPVAQFSGERNWGYDGVFPWAVQHSYGGPEGLRRFVDACHARGLAVVLDVVHNHLGPEGNVLPRFAPYFSRTVHTPWGPTPAFDGPHAADVRRYFLESALAWIEDFHVDGLRLDAVESIRDRSPERFEAELARVVAERARQLGRRVHLFPESDLSRPDLVTPREEGGCGLAAQWSDDLCYALHPLTDGLTGGRHARYGRVSDVAKAIRDGWVRPDPNAERVHGSYEGAAAGRFIVFAQNHDQVSRAPASGRSASRATAEVLRLMAAVVLHAPDLPLLFMGEEYGETAPFPFFTSHEDRELGARVRRGRERDLRAMGHGDPVPDPQAKATFLRAKLDEKLAEREEGRALRAWYRELIRLRRSVEWLRRPERGMLAVESDEREQTVLLRRGDAAVAAYHFGAGSTSVVLPAGRWRTIADSAQARWDGAGSGVPEDFEDAAPREIELRPWQYVLLARD